MTDPIAAAPAGPRNDPLDLSRDRLTARPPDRPP